MLSILRAALTLGSTALALTLAACNPMPDHMRDAPSPQASPVVRADLLTAALGTPAVVERVEVKRVEMVPGVASGRHLHPVPVVGVVTRGSVTFQVEGDAPRVLGVGDVFFEPAHVPVARFDAGGAGAVFVAYYLVGPGGGELVRMLP